MYQINLTAVAGSIIAAILSWKRNKDIAWAVVAAIFGWLYVIYWWWSEYID
jgi:hypothetical protein